MKIFLSAGEASGDMYGAALIEAVKKIVPGARFCGFGGKAMRDAGMEVRLDLTRYDVMWLKAFRHVKELAGVLNEAERGFAADPPDVVVPIDYPGFNLRLAARARKNGVKVVYYISPQIWAWWKGRIKRIARCVDKMLVIFPFEEGIYREAGVDCEYVGHPLMGRLSQRVLNSALVGELAEWGGDGCLVGLLPGSRYQELRRHLPVMLDAARIVLGQRPETRFVIPCRSHDHFSAASGMAAGLSDRVRCVEGGVMEAMRAADICVASSGTTTVELMYFEKPMVVMYRVPPMQYLAAKIFMRVPHIAMVNILAGRPLVPEHLMCRKRSSDVAASVLSLIASPGLRSETSAALAELRKSLAGGDASGRAAASVVAVCRVAGGVEAPA